MNDENPYAPPETPDFPESAELPPISVVGEYLVVTAGTELPRRCVFTNQLVERSLEAQPLRWTPLFKRRNWRLGQLRLAVCDSRRRRHRIRPYLAAGALNVAAIVFYLMDGQAFAPIIIIFCAVLMVLDLPPYLPVAKYQNERFWLKGCGEEFLQSCREEFASVGKEEA